MKTAKTTPESIGEYFRSSPGHFDYSLYRPDLYRPTPTHILVEDAMRRAYRTGAEEAEEIIKRFEESAGLKYHSPPRFGKRRLFLAGIIILSIAIGITVFIVI